MIVFRVSKPFLGTLVFLLVVHLRIQSHQDNIVLFVFLGIKKENYSTSNSSDQALNKRPYQVNLDMWDDLKQTRRRGRQ